MVKETGDSGAVDVPEEAVERLAVFHYNLTHDIGEKHGTPWVGANETEKNESRKEARWRLAQQLLPAIRQSVEEEVREQILNKGASALAVELDRLNREAVAGFLPAEIGPIANLLLRAALDHTLLSRGERR